MILVPTCLYHVAQGAKVFETVESVEEALKNGWETTPNKIQKAEELRAQIQFHRDEIKSKTLELQGLSGKEAEWVCEECGRTFTNKLGLVSHQRTHKIEEV
jgi:transposase-like protein